MDPHQSVLKATPNRHWRFVPLLLLANACCLPTHRPMNIWPPKAAKVPHHVCPQLVQSRVGTVVVANLQTFTEHCVLATQNLCPTPKGNTFPPASCTGSANETAMVVVGLASPAGRVTVPFGTITCSATAWSNTTTKVRHETFSEATGCPPKAPTEPHVNAVEDAVPETAALPYEQLSVHDSSKTVFGQS